MSRTDAATLLVVAAAVVVGLDVDVPVLRPLLALVLLVGVPTWTLFHILTASGDRAAVRLMYAAGLTVLGLVLGALVLNAALPAIGVERPLRPAVVAGASLLADLALLRSRRDEVEDVPVRPVRLLRRLLAARWRLPWALGTAAVLLAVAGAVRLNNGAGGGVSLAALVLVAATVLVLLVREGTSVRDDLAGLGLAAVALLLATSLRGWTITGHDIQSEFLAFRLTDEAQRWDPGHWENAYNACLSITILPSVLAQATGLSGVVVFKVLMQVGFALVPLLTYLIARRFLDRRAAVASAVVLMAFPTFYTDMPYLVRQEVAFFFVALMLLAGTAPDARGRPVLVGAFGIGVVVSHYSTTYVLLISLLAALVAVTALRRWRHRSGSPEVSPDPARLALVHPGVIVLLAVSSWAWAGPMTGTGGHAIDVTRDAIAAILGDGDDAPGSSDRRHGLWWSAGPDPDQRLDMFVDETFELRRTVDPEVLLVSRPGPAVVDPEVVEVSEAETTALGAALEDVGVDPGTVSNAFRAASAVLIQVLILVGGAVVVGAFLRRRARGISDEVVAVVVGTGAALGVVVVVPSLSVDYGVLRAFQQALLVLSPVVVVGAMALARRLTVPERTVVILVPLLLLATLSGLAAAPLGGHQPRLALANAGLYYERYHAADADSDAVRWLTATDHGADQRPRIVANRNLGVRILSADPDANVDDRLFPTLLARGDHVLVDSRLAETGRSSVFYTGDLITYRYPLSVVETRLDLVYSSSSTRIYR